MITAGRMAAVDRNAAALGIPRAKLMESSGNAVAAAVRQRASPGDRVLIVCGRGNNGGDGMVAARFLSDYDRRVVLLGRPSTIRTEIARKNWDALVQSEIETETLRDATEFQLEGADISVDAMLGTGVTGSLREPESTVAAALNAASVPIVSVDVPSGVDADSGQAVPGAVNPEHVVTFHDSKPGLADVGASVEVADIGIPDAAERFVGPGDLHHLTRDPNAHKGDHGEVLVIGGGPYTGAPALAGQAALRAGADLVRVGCPERVAREVQGFEEGLIVHAFDGGKEDRVSPAQLDHIRSLAADHDVIVLGPGLGAADETLAAVREFLTGFEGTCVIDADALRVVPAVETEADLILTPHAGEFRRIAKEPGSGWRARADRVTATAAELDQTVLLKGRYDVVSDGETIRVNRTGTPAMTVGGTGDVLAGVVGALAARLPPVTAGSVGAYANGLAGETAVSGRNSGLLASDLLAELPDALTDDGGDRI